MHGELIFESPGGQERSVRGDARVVDESSLEWEMHDRQLSRGEVEEVARELELVRAQGGEVRIVFVDPGPLLDEVESGPRIEFDETLPFTCRIISVDSDDGVVHLERLPAVS